MPNIKSSKKRAVLSRESQKANIVVRSRMKNTIKACREASPDAQDREVLLQRAFSSIDKAAKHNIIHKRNADRKKSRLQKNMNAES